MFQGDKRIYCSVHVDDVILMDPIDKEKEDLSILEEENHSITPGGNLIQPAPIHPKVGISVLKVRRKHGLPYHATLESYCPENDWEPGRLVGDSAALFRSSLGLILHIAQDRPDIQFSTQVLATYTPISSIVLGWYVRRWNSPTEV